MRSTRKVVGATVIAVATATTMLATATNALAAPGNCTITFALPGATAASLCTTGTGHHRIDLVIFQDNAGENAVEGNWAAVGQYSTVNTSWEIVNSWVELSNT
jgi:hypothetical protein